MPVRTRQCRHVFGYQCIKEWVTTDRRNSNKCPVCRKQFFAVETPEAVDLGNLEGIEQDEDQDANALENAATEGDEEESSIERIEDAIWLSNTQQIIRSIREHIDGYACEASALQPYTDRENGNDFLALGIKIAIEATDGMAERYAVSSRVTRAERVLLRARIATEIIVSEVENAIDRALVLEFSQPEPRVAAHAARAMEDAITERDLDGKDFGESFVENDRDIAPEADVEMQDAQAGDGEVAKVHFESSARDLRPHRLWTRYMASSDMDDE